MDNPEYAASVLTGIGICGMCFLVAWVVSRIQPAPSRSEEPPELATLGLSFDEKKSYSFVLLDPFLRKETRVRIVPYSNSFDVQFDTARDGYLFMVNNGRVDVVKIFEDKIVEGGALGPPISSTPLNNTGEPACRKS